MPKVKSLDDLNNLINGMTDDGEGFVDEEETLEEEAADPAVSDPDFVEKDENTESKSENVEEENEEPAADENDEPAETEETETKETDSYTPNLKYKAMKSEYDLPDYLASVIDSPEKEEEIKKVYSKAMGMDHFAQKYEGVKSQLDQVTPVMQDVNIFNNLLQKKQYHSAFKMAGLSDQDVLQVASQIIQMEDLTPEQKAAYNNTVDSNQRQLQLEVENQRLREQYENTSANNQVQELDNIITDQSTKSVVDQYEQRVGKVGSFKEAVINHAAMIEFQTKNNPNGPQILTPREAVDSFMNVMGMNSLPQATGEETVITPQTETQTTQRVVTKRVKPSIPQVNGGSSTSPAKKKVRSIADLQKLAEDLDDY